MSLQSDFEDLIAEFEDNLQTMGVDDAEFDSTTGLMGLVARILDIEPALVGITLYTNITCNCPSESNMNIPFTITGVLTGSYDDTNASNVDLVDVKLKGATVEIYDGNVKLGEAITDEDGVYRYIHTPTTVGTLNICAVYDSSNDYYNDTASNSYSVSITLVISSLTLEAIYDNQGNVTLNATLLGENNNPLSNQTVSFDIVNHNDGTILENIGIGITDTNGIASISYELPNNSVEYVTVRINNVISEQLRISDEVKQTSFTGTSLNYVCKSPFVGSSNLTIDWGDGTSELYTGGDLTHTYSTNATYTVSIIGDTTDVGEYTMENILYAPTLTGDSGAIWGYQYSEADGVAIGKGFALGSWSNSGLWEINCNFRHDNIRYTGILFVCDESFNGVSGSQYCYWSWEGSWPGGDAYAWYGSGTVGWFDLTVKKIDNTHLNLKSVTLNRDTIVEVDWLPLLSNVRFGAVHNIASSGFGPCEIRDVVVKGFQSIQWI